ncbi:MAG: hypothetical protein Q9219_007062 [cf. Caloplaca sp. 3 TL-2023]
MPVSTFETPSRRDADEVYDLVCVGFGPASLAIAVALHDQGVTARVLYIERQRGFTWHGGMLLPDARMQISFLKDLATLRDPRSRFTFLNYLKSKNRLVAFTNLSTFLPLREEYNDYLGWCASHFDQYVRYGQETLEISPHRPEGGLVEAWDVLSKDVTTSKKTVVRARHVVVAVGGKPKVPTALADSAPDSPIVHSSSYSHTIPQILTDRRKKSHVAVIGGGQSSAEIFNDLQSRFDNISVSLYTGDSALRPSDDSPFVNEIFDPNRVDEFYELPNEAQKDTLQRNKATNYGVVRPELLDRLYELMYHQRLQEPNDQMWRYKIVPRRETIGYDKQDDGRILLKLRNTLNGEIGMSEHAFDLVIVATGYVRNIHETMLKSTKDLLQTGKYDIGRDYKVKYKEDAVADTCGIWLQGCCQDSHGLSDTLLSILAVRGGEIVKSVFPQVAGLSNGHDRPR